jgi:hypothetical protein
LYRAVSKRENFRHSAQAAAMDRSEADRLSSAGMPSAGTALLNRYP